MSPWDVAGFDGENPTLGSVAGANRVKMYHKVLFVDLLAPMLYRGSEARSQAVALRRTSFELFQEIDLLEKSAQESQAHDESCTVWPAPLALLGDVSSQDADSTRLLISLNIH